MRGKDKPPARVLKAVHGQTVVEPDPEHEIMDSPYDDCSKADRPASFSTNPRTPLPSPLNRSSWAILSLIPLLRQR